MGWAVKIAVTDNAGLPVMSLELVVSDGFESRLQPDPVGPGPGRNVMQGQMFVVMDDRLVPLGHFPRPLHTLPTSEMFGGFDLIRWSVPFQGQRLGVQFLVPAMQITQLPPDPDYLLDLFRRIRHRYAGNFTKEVVVEPGSVYGRMENPVNVIKGIIPA